MWNLIEHMNHLNAEAMASATPEQIEKLNQWNVHYAELLEARKSLVFPNRWTRDTPTEEREAYWGNTDALDWLLKQARNLITPGWDMPNYVVTPADRFAADLE